MNVIDKYKQVKQELFAHFNYNGYDYGIEDHTDCYWKINGREVEWSEEQWNEDDDPEYSDEMRGIYRADDLTMVLVYSCTGDNYLAVFDNSKERTISKKFELLIKE